MKRAFVLASTFLLLVSCQQIKYRDVIGLWVLDEVNGQKVPTKELFVCDYQSPTSQILASGYLFADSDNRWGERDTYHYSVRYNAILLNGQDAVGEDVELKFMDNVFTDSTWSYTVHSSRIDGVNFVDGSRYTLKKLDSKGYDVQSILGNWVLQSINGNPTNPICCQMHPEGTFSYYQFDTVTQRFSLKEDTQGNFFLYGNILAMNYSSNSIKTPGCFFDCWEIEKLEGDTMSWYMKDTTEFRVELHRMPLE